MNVFRKFFCKSQKLELGKEPELEKKIQESDLEKKECELVEYVINLLRDKPQDFSLEWFRKGQLEHSIMNKSKKIQIMNSGLIIQPIEPKMTTEQKGLVSELAAKVFERDKVRLVNSILEEINNL